MDTHFDRRHEYYDDTYKAPILDKKQCGNMPSLHLLEDDDNDQVINSPDQVFEHNLRTLADRSADKNLFEDEHPRTEANNVTGHTNSWYNGHRGYGNSAPVHPELNQEFFNWVEPRGTALEADRSKLVNQDAYRLRYKYLHPSGAVSTPERGMYDKDLRDMAYSANWSALGQLKVFYRSLENFVRSGLTPKPTNKKRNLTVFTKSGFSKSGVNPKSEGGTSVSKYNPDTLRKLRAHGLDDTSFARNYEEALRSNPEIGEYWTAGRKHGQTDAEQFSQSDTLPILKKNTKREVKSLTRFLQENDGKLSKQEKTLIRRTVKSGHELLNRLRHTKTGQHDTKFSSGSTQDTARRFGKMLQKVSNTPTMRKMDTMTGFKESYAPIRGTISKNMPKSMRGKNAYEKFKGKSHNTFIQTQSQMHKNPNHVRQQMVANILGSNGKESFVYSRNANVANDPHKRGMDKFSDARFGQEKNTLIGKTAGARNPYGFRQYTQMETQSDFDNEGLMNHRGGGAGTTGIAKNTIADINH